VAETDEIPESIVQEMRELGLFGMTIPEKFGGLELTMEEECRVLFELCQTAPAFRSIIGTTVGIGSQGILMDGTPEQQAQWLPKLATGEVIASFALTEPEAGSDAASLRTTAIKDGDHYIVNGVKQFISGAGTSDIYVLMARTSDDGAKGVSTFIIEKGTPGLSFGANERKMGWKSQPTAQVILDEVRVPAANRIGEEGHGFRFAMAGLDGGRINIAACALGGAQLALDKAVAYAKDRKQFGKAIADFQSVQFKLADMETELQAARVMLYEAAGRLDGKTPDATRWCAMAKRFVTDTAFKVANDALQIHGGYGYLADYHVERIVRDLRVHQILEGTNEIMRVIISRDMLKG
jgi:alkylation response protein AidB-like acyl-CoA dehydrogenase